MNQFTKQELLMLKEWSSYCDYIPKELIDKINLLVINYREECAHEWENTCCSCSIYLIQCEKCDLRLSELK
jgi:hypothetical protein